MRIDERLNLRLVEFIRARMLAPPAPLVHGLSA